ETQATDSTGLKTDPTVATVRIFKETGGAGAFDNTELAGSPFTITKINAKDGNYGVKVAKSLFTAGNYYRVLFEETVDGITTASEKTYFMLNSSSVKANVSGLAIEGNVEGHVDTALASYDGPTRSEATSDKDEIIVEVNANEAKIDTLLENNQFNIDEFRTFTYDGIGRTATMTIRLTDIITPTAIWVYTFTYDGNGNVDNVAIERTL
ncbi:hypothetical protein LCGC14_2071930, partial [marine sediment metagenome]